MKIVALAMRVGKSVSDEVIMFMLKKIISWFFSKENITKVKNQIIENVKKKAEKEGVDIWDYLEEYAVPVIKNDFTDMKSFLADLIERQAEKDSEDGFWKKLKEVTDGLFEDYRQ